MAILCSVVWIENFEKAQKKYAATAISTIIATTVVNRSERRGGFIATICAAGSARLILVRMFGLCWALQCRLLCPSAPAIDVFARKAPFPADPKTGNLLCAHEAVNRRRMHAQIFRNFQHGQNLRTDAKGALAFHWIN
jgi:hypothetical protein